MAVGPIATLKATGARERRLGARALMDHAEDEHGVSTVNAENKIWKALELDAPCITADKAWQIARRAIRAIPRSSSATNSQRCRQIRVGASEEEDAAAKVFTATRVSSAVPTKAVRSRRVAGRGEGVGYGRAADV